MKSNYKLIVVVILLSSVLDSYAQKISIRDSIDIRNKTNAFYDWYISQMKSGVVKELFPVFVPDDNGMTTLDMTVYVDNLRKNHFSENLILKEIETYKNCLKNLESIPYEIFRTTFLDLDQFEEIQCDFQNYYHWGGGQEGFDKIEILQIQRLNKKEIQVQLYYLECDPNGECTRWFNPNCLKFRNYAGVWKIDSLE